MTTQEQIRSTEASLISAIFFDSNALREASARISPECFFDFPLGKVYGAILALAEAGEAPTLQGVAIALERASMLEYVGGTARLADLVGGAGATANVRSYCAIIRADYERRQIRHLAFEVYHGLEPVGASVDDAVARLNSSNQFLLGRALESTSGTDALLKAAAAESTARPVPTGLPGIDRLLKGGGLRPGNLCAVGGRPAMGKTAFVATCARNAALAGFAVGFVTLEMSDAELAERLAVHRPECLRLIQFAMPRRGSVKSVEAIASRWKQEGLMDFLVIDYLGLLYPEGRRVSRYEDVSDISQDLKRLARSLEVPIMVAVQLSRAVIGRADNKPQLSDFRDSGSVEQDCDQAILLHRPGYYNGNRNDPVAYADLAKQRNGPTDDVRLHWLATETRFAHYSAFPEQSTP